MESSRIKLLIEKLETSSKINNIEWEKSNNKPNQFTYSGLNYTIVISQRSDVVQGVVYEICFLDIYNEEGDHIDRIEAIESYIKPDPNFLILKSIYENAKRIALKIDQTLKNIFNDLS